MVYPSPKDLHRGGVAEAITERKSKLEALLKKHPLDTVEHEIHLIDGMPSRLIPKIADEHKVDVLVLGTVTHRRHSSHFIGTTAEDFVHQIDCSVLAVKPADFVSVTTMK
jgi:universal stress protein E